MHKVRAGKGGEGASEYCRAAKRRTLLLLRRQSFAPRRLCVPACTKRRATHKNIKYVLPANKQHVLYKTCRLVI